MTRIDWLGIGYIATGALVSAILFLTAGGIALIPLLEPADPAWPALLVAAFSAVLGVTHGALYAATGIGIGARRPWARIAGIVLGAMSLQSVPFGTALGAFSLWTLLDADVAAEFRG